MKSALDKNFFNLVEQEPIEQSKEHKRLDDEMYKIFESIDDKHKKIFDEIFDLHCGIMSETELASFKFGFKLAFSIFKELSL